MLPFFLSCVEVICPGRILRIVFMQEHGIKWQLQPNSHYLLKGSAPEALFHLLDKTLLLKHLKELKAEKTVNRKACHMSYIKWEGLNQTQRNKSISFLVSHLTDGVCFAINDIGGIDENDTMEDRVVKELAK
jgi:hypothetical protein